MTPLEAQLVNYAIYHRDARNIKTHILGIPMIALGLLILTSPTLVVVSSINISLAALIVFGATVYYIRLDFKLGLLMGMLGFAGLLLSQLLASVSYWLLGAGLFLSGWIIQFIGHYWEGKKAAFFDDIVGLIIGPLFIVTELLFMLNRLQHLRATIERQAGAER